MMKCLLLSVVVVLLLHHEQLVVVGMLDEELSDLWTRFKITHNKLYTDDNEDNYRRSVFAKNVEYISLHNIQAELGQHTFTLGINKFTDLTTDEFQHYMLGALPSRDHDFTNHTYDGEFDDVTLPVAVDWRDKGYVTRVKDQGRCGSCWAFSATGALEGQWFKKTGYLVSLSEQNLVDCDKGDYGCRGGWPYMAYEYIIKNNGIDTELSYQYDQQEGKVMPCRYKPSTVGARCRGYLRLKPLESVLQQAVAVVGPISVAISVQDSFKFYKSGVYNEPKCTQSLNHAVLAVGYGTLQGQDYWIVKNSWGASWGMQGYILMARNKNNQCGIANEAVFPVV